MPNTRQNGEAPETELWDWAEGDPIATESDDSDFDPEAEAERMLESGVPVPLMSEEGDEEGGRGEGMESFYEVEGGDDDDDDDDDEPPEMNDDDDDEEVEEQEEQEEEEEAWGSEGESDHRVVHHNFSREILRQFMESGIFLRTRDQPTGYLEFCRSLPIAPEPLKNMLGNDIRIITSPEDPRLSLTPASSPMPREGADGAASGSTRSSPGGGLAALGHAGASPSSPAVQPVTPREMLRRREVGRAGEGLGKAPGGLTQAQCTHMSAFAALPTKPVRIVDRNGSSCYTARFSPDGTKLVAGFQSQQIRMYDVRNKWKLAKDVEAINIRWTITDTCLSNDQRFLFYSTIDSVVHMCTLEASGGVSSVSNMTDVHEGYDINILEGDNPDENLRRNYNHGIWAIRLSGDGRELIAGTSQNSLYVYDIEKQKTVCRATDHGDDVNAVAYLDPECNIIATGSDDSYIKVWDRRMLRRERNKPVGVMPGHTEGITYLDSRGDGRYFISNAKDQSVKLWDLRSMAPQSYGKSRQEATLQEKLMLPDYDYRSSAYSVHKQRVPQAIIHPNDKSIQTYRGHCVQGTLIRAYFSPLETTGQRFIYSGSYKGAVHIWDLVSGEEVHNLRLHRGPVRDVTWSPTEPLLVSTSFDGTIVEWRPEAYSDKALGVNDVLCGARSRYY